MWIEVKISDEKYFISCKTNEENHVECVLYDGQESWLEKQPLDVILQRAKDLNRRVEFDDNAILETLHSGSPIQASWLLGDSYHKRNLKLKYRVHECPLNFNWNFGRQTEHDFQKFILFPLFRIVEGLSQQNEELRDAVRRKDVEIKQYKIEGAILRRKTIETPQFNFENFEKKHAESIALLKSVMQISDLLKAQYTPSQGIKSPSKEQNAQKSAEKDQASNDKEKDVKLTPRRKRRKMVEEQQRIIAEKLKARGKPLQYESSQSEQLSGNSQDNSDVDRPKETTSRLEEKLVINTKEEVEDHTPQTTPSKFLRKRKGTFHLEYDRSDSSSEEEEEQIRSPRKLRTKDKSNGPTTNPSSPPIVSKEQQSDDIQSLLDEWKALEKRRVADLSNTRSTRTSKRLNF